MTWIAFEGGDGSGKSTQARLLAERLGAVLTREPGGTELGARVRELLLEPGSSIDERAETLLMAADRAQHVRQVVEPALVSGRHVVSDRSAFSSLAYQGYGRGLGVDEVRRICAWASGDRWPDLAVLLQVDPRQQRSRMRGAPDRMESSGDAFHARVAAGFVALASEDPDRWCVVDGSGSIDEVAGRVWDACQHWLG